MKRRKETDRFRERVDLGARHTAEARFHDQKYASGHSFPRHYRVSPTYPVSQRLLALVGMELAGQRVLEYGCGNGWITAQLAERGAAVSAFDVSPEAVRQTTALLEGQGLHLRASVRVMPGEHLDYQSCSFDSAIGFAILHHLDLDSALPELHRVLKPGGRAFFAEPLASNGLVRLYRRLTPQFRTVDERPIDIAEILLAFEIKTSAYYPLENKHLDCLKASVDYWRQWVKE